MSDPQAEAVSRILSEMATKKDVELLRLEVRAELREIRADLRTGISEVKADLTWRFLAMMGFFAAVMTAVDLFVD